MNIVKTEEHVTYTTTSYTLTNIVELNNGPAKVGSLESNELYNVYEGLEDHYDLNEVSSDYSHSTRICLVVMKNTIELSQLGKFYKYAIDAKFHSAYSFDRLGGRVYNNIKGIEVSKLPDVKFMIY